MPMQLIPASAIMAKYTIYRAEISTEHRPAVSCRDWPGQPVRLQRHLLCVLFSPRPRQIGLRPREHFAVTVRTELMWPRAYNKNEFRSAIERPQKRQCAVERDISTTTSEEEREQGRSPAPPPPSAAASVTPAELGGRHKIDDVRHGSLDCH